MAKTGKKKSYLVIKRFACDDVPVLLTGNFKLAEQKAKRIVNIMDRGAVFATKAEQKLMQLDIGTELCSVGVITFNPAGKPTSQNIYYPEEKKTIDHEWTRIDTKENGG